MQDNPPMLKLDHDISIDFTDPGNHSVLLLAYGTLFKTKPFNPILLLCF